MTREVALVALAPTRALSVPEVLSATAGVAICVQTLNDADAAAVYRRLRAKNGDFEHCRTDAHHLALPLFHWERAFRGMGIFWGYRMDF